MSMRSRRPLVALVLAAILVLAACGSSDTLEGEVVKDGVGCAPTSVARPTELPAVEPITDLGDAVETEDLVEGKGCAIDTEVYAALDLVGATADDATVFTNTIEQGRPLTVNNAAQDVLLPSLQEALSGLKVGGRRQIAIPAELAYGADGLEAQAIGPDEDLVFIVELVSVSSKIEYCAAAELASGRPGQPLGITMPIEAPKELKVTVREEGTGAEVAADDYVTANYVGFLCSSGQVFENSWELGQKVTFTMPDAEQTATVGPVIEGWTEGVAGQKVGSLLQLDIPSKMAYGTRGQGSIGPDEPLTFLVRIEAATKETPPDPTTTTVAGATETTAPADGTTETTVAAPETTAAGDDAVTTTAG